MNKFHLFFLLISIHLSTILEKKEKKSRMSFTTKEVDEGIYNIILEKRNSILSYLGNLRTSREKYGFPLLDFKITFADKDKKYCYIRHVQSGLYIGVKKYEISYYDRFDKDELQIEVSDNIIKDEKNRYINYQWQFLKEKGKDSSFIIKNKIGCILNEIRNRFFCSFNDKRTSFNFMKLYEEKKKNITDEEKKILDDEPIDVFIKYIDVNDPNLKRNNLTQIEKDKENEELKYCVRSILANIPWIRKIFILMPNEKVRFFKNYSEINEKIIYVKDKEILGHESANIHAFQFRIWKLKEYGLSENFISMDDDYFIGKPMEKSDFFYVENNKVFPLIINKNYGLQTEKSTRTEIQNNLKKLEKNKRNQTSDEFTYTVYRTYLFLIQYFNSQVLVPYFTHNAIPVKCSDLKEIFDIIDNSTEFSYPTLYSLNRNRKSLQYQTSLVVYTFNKYKRKVNKINYNYIDAANTIKGNFDFNLFCINTGGNNDYSELAFAEMKIIMEKLFPFPTKYELNESKSLAETSFKVIKKLDNDYKILNDEKKLEELEKEQFLNEKISNKYDKYNNQLDFLKAENYAYKTKIEKINLEFEKCKKEFIMNEKKLNELEKTNETYYLLNEIKRKLEIVNNDNFIYEQKINEYTKENEKYLDNIKKRKNDEKLMYFMIYFQLILIISVVIAISIVYNKNKKEKNEEIKTERYNGYKNI